MQDIIYRELRGSRPGIKVGILLYTGKGDPVSKLDAAVHEYVQNKGYNEYIDANMDNPWIRVIIQGLNEIPHKKFNPTIDHLD
jgi:hypothetical protein